MWQQEVLTDDWHIVLVPKGWFNLDPWFIPCPFPRVHLPLSTWLWYWLVSLGNIGGRRVGLFTCNFPSNNFSGRGAWFSLFVALHPSSLLVGGGGALSCPYLSLTNVHHVILLQSTQCKARWCCVDHSYLFHAPYLYSTVSRQRKPFHRRFVILVRYVRWDMTGLLGNQVWRDRTSLLLVSRKYCLPLCGCKFVSCLAICNAPTARWF